jgi:hypothetical protein
VTLFVTFCRSAGNDIRSLFALRFKMHKYLDNRSITARGSHIGRTSTATTRNQKLKNWTKISFSFEFLFDFCKHLPPSLTLLKQSNAKMLNSVWIEIENQSREEMRSRSEWKWAVCSTLDSGRPESSDIFTRQQQQQHWWESLGHIRRAQSERLKCSGSILISRFYRRWTLESTALSTLAIDSLSRRVAIIYKVIE